MRNPEDIKNCVAALRNAADDLEESGMACLEADHLTAAAKTIEALMADLTTVCETVNTCLVCDHYRTDWAKPGCELNGLTCAWKWRGVKGDAGT